MIYSIAKILDQLGIHNQVNLGLSFVILIILVLSFSWIADFITKTYLVRIIGGVLERFRPALRRKIDQHHVISRASHLAPALIIYLCADLFVYEGQNFTVKMASFIKNFSFIYMIIAIAISIDALIAVFEEIYNTYRISKRRPIKSYLQVVKTILYFLTITIIISILLDKSPWAFFTGLGAATAVILLVFKDSILGFVASIQISSYDMIRIGDWITINEYGVDGDVIEISLTTVKVRNFDKTIVTIPTYSLLSTGVKNWRGMHESKGRRIKRSIKINMHTIKFCDQNMLDRLRSVKLLKSFIEDRSASISKSNSALSAELLNTPINGRRLTNIGLFRAYLKEYLKTNEAIHQQGFTFLVRQLQPTETGLPIELYIFTKTTDWAEFEDIQSDIFDHVFAAMHFFELEAFQSIHH